MEQIAITIQLKKCNVCEQKKPATLNNFYMNRNSSDRLLNRCKECVTRLRQQKQQ